jgi:formylglycine-generating enzyme required for sulfatase activity
MLLISGGKVFLGARDLTDDAKPPHEVSIATYCLDKTEVTGGAYDACADKSDCERAQDHVSFKNITEPLKKLYSPLCTGGKPDRSSHPINCVTWSMADKFCQKRNARLPTEAEWEYAARGSRQRNYPWGDDAPSAKFLNACGKECVAWGATKADPHDPMYEEDDGHALTAPVGSFPAGASTHGVLDLAGNVWEWTADWYAPYTAEPAENPKGPAKGTERVARGGHYFGSMPEWARPAYRWKTDPETYSHAVGFRCAKDVAGGK